jgi:mannose-1-phosphate guanylyltransferase
VRRFEEKPSPGKARRYVADRRRLWNCGIFAWRAAVFRAAVETHLSALAEAFRALEDRRPTGRVLAGAYSRAPAISVDYGVLERAANVAVVPADFPWDDLGSWGALERLGRDGGYERGRVLGLDSPGLVAWAERGAVAVVGVKDVVVVHTPDATLVVAKDRAQDVRRIVEELERSPATRALVEDETKP